mgnify:CR=1 FL=1
MAHRIFEISDKADPLSAEIFRDTSYSDNGQQDAFFVSDLLCLYGKIEINAIGTYIVLFSLLYPQTQTAPQHGKTFPTDIMPGLRCVLSEFSKLLLCLSNVTAASFHKLCNNTFRDIFRSRNINRGICPNPKIDIAYVLSF